MIVSETWINTYVIRTQEKDVNRNLKLIHIQFFPILKVLNLQVAAGKYSPWLYTVHRYSTVLHGCFHSVLGLMCFLHGSHHQHAFCSCLNPSFKWPSPFYLKVKSYFIMIIPGVWFFLFLFVWLVLFCFAYLFNALIKK